MFKKIIVGLGIIYLGVILLLNNMGINNLYLYNVNIVNLILPLFIFLFGLGITIDSRKFSLTSLIVIVIGVYMVLQTLNLITLSLSKIIAPTIIMLIGFNIILSIGFKKKEYDSNIAKCSPDVTVASLFSGNDVKNESKDFKKASITAIFGGSTLDLSDASTNLKECFIDVTAIFGGAEIKVPSNWKVNTDGIACMFGGVENKKTVAEQEGPTVYVTGTAIFGGLEIK